MSDSWTAIEVEDIKAHTPNALATGPFGSAISARHFQDEGIPVIRGSNLSHVVGQRLILDNLVFLSEEKAREFSRSIARRGDLIFTCWGTIGQVGLIDERSSFEEFVVSNKQMKLTPDPKKADSLFLYFLFSSPEVSQLIKNQAIGSSVPGFNLGQLRALRLRLPPLAVQREIAGLLGAIDDKMDLNLRMNETLEQIAQLLFKSRFIDVDQDQERMLTLGEIVSLDKEKVEPALHPDEMFAHYSIPAFDSGKSPTLQRGRAIKSSKFRVPPDAVLLSRLNPRIPRVWLPDVGGEAPAISSTEFALARPKPGISREFIFGLFSSPGFQARLQALVTGTSGSHQRVKPEDLLRMDVPVSDQSAIDAYTGFVRPLLQLVASNLRQSAALGQVRDLLLPNLISGKIQIKEANRAVSAAL